MARGASGRIVLEVEPELKDDLYVQLAREGRTLRAWFVEQASSYLARAHQPALLVAEPAGEYRASGSAKASDSAGNRIPSGDKHHGAD